MAMLSARLFVVVGHALAMLDEIGQDGPEPYVSFDGTLTTATLDGEILEFEVEYEDGKHFAALPA